MIQSRRRESSRQVLLVGATLFIASCLFPIAASVLPVDSLPRWVGAVDVAIAALVVIMGMVVISRGPIGLATAVVARSFTAYRGLANMMLLLLALFFLVGHVIRWDVLLVGLAWRAWLFTMVLPPWLSAWHTE